MKDFYWIVMKRFYEIEFISLAVLLGTAFLYVKTMSNVVLAINIMSRVTLVAPAWARLIGFIAEQAAPKVMEYKEKVGRVVTAETMVKTR